MYLKIVVIQNYYSDKTLLRLCASVTEREKVG